MLGFAIHWLQSHCFLSVARVIQFMTSDFLSFVIRAADLSICCALTLFWSPDPFPIIQSHPCISKTGIPCYRNIRSYLLSDPLGVGLRYDVAEATHTAPHLGFKHLNSLWKLPNANNKRISKLYVYVSKSWALPTQSRWKCHYCKIKKFCFFFYKHKLHFHFLERAEDGRGMKWGEFTEKGKKTENVCIESRSVCLGKSGITLVLVT